jgi:hypothetical protein
VKEAALEAEPPPRSETAAADTNPKNLAIFVIAVSIPVKNAQSCTPFTA